MKLKQILYLLITIALIVACIEEFDPQINESADLLVVQASVIKGDTLQYVEISRSSPFGSPEKRPVADCVVQMIDDKGNVFHFVGDDKGTYTTEIPQQYLNYNSQYHLQITTPDKNIYESEVETILEGSPVDTVYYAEEPYQSSSVYYENGLQFYLDLKAPNISTRNYRWTIDETWEYHSKYPIYATWDEEQDTLIQEFTIEFYSCWKTLKVPGFYSASTENLVVNEKKNIPLHFIPDIDPKLIYGYCATVKQYTLSDKAYEYWNRNKVESSESGGLYQTQPSQSRSNIHNINDPEEIVLGYFWASSYTQKRAFSKGNYVNKHTSSETACVADTIDLADIGTRILNRYYTDLSARPDTIIWGTTDEYCFDCRARGGANIKPDFWIY